MTDATPASPPASVCADPAAMPGRAVACRRIVLITGLSGAGLSVTLKALEDLGYEAVDNLRLSLIPALVHQGETGTERPLALVIDSRTRDFSAEVFERHLESLAARPDLLVKLLFLECANDVLQRRFTETRRRHPLAVDRPVADGIQHERRLLAPLRDRADVVIDSTALSIHDLRRMLTGHFHLEATPGLQVFVSSFSFRLGLPREADLVFDVRFLRNPHWEPALRPLTGQNPAVAAHVAADPEFPAFFDNLTRLLLPLLPRFHQEGKCYLTIAVGCTGGRHRSVFVAERLAACLRDAGFAVGLAHRDLERPVPRPG